MEYNSSFLFGFLSATDPSEIAVKPRSCKEHPISFLSKGLITYSKYLKRLKIQEE